MNPSTFHSSCGGRLQGASLTRRSVAWAELTEIWRPRSYFVRFSYFCLPHMQKWTDFSVHQIPCTRIVLPFLEGFWFIEAITYKIHETFWCLTTERSSRQRVGVKNNFGYKYQRDICILVQYSSQVVTNTKVKKFPFFVLLNKVSYIFFTLSVHGFLSIYFSLQVSHVIQNSCTFKGYVSK